MKSMTIIGIVLIVIGAVALVLQGITSSPARRSPSLVRSKSLKRHRGRFPCRLSWAPYCLWVGSP